MKQQKQSNNQIQWNCFLTKDILYSSVKIRTRGNQKRALNNMTETDMRDRFIDTDRTIDIKRAR